MTESALLSEERKMRNWRGSYLWFVALSNFCQRFSVIGTGTYVLVSMANWDVLANTQITLLTIVGLPGYLKMFPGLLSDRVPVGRCVRRKPYILLGGLLFLPAFFLLVMIDEFGAAWILAILLALFGWLLVDTPLDALTVEITPRDLTGKMQSAVQSSRSIGALLGTLLVPLLGPRVGWTPVLIVLGVSALLMSGAALLVRDIPISGEDLRRQLALKSVLRETYSHKLVWLSLFFFLFFSARAISRLVNIYLLNELDWSSSPEMMQHYALVGVLSSVAGALGAILMGRLPSRWITSFKFYVGYLVVIWVLRLPFVIIYNNPDNLALIYLVTIPIGIVGGAGGVLTIALAMRVCPKSIEGFSFALMMSVINFGAGALGPKTAGALIEPLGGVLPAIYSLIPYGLLSLVFLYPLLKLLNQEQAASPAAA